MIRFISAAFALLLLSSCSLYESEARKFIREQGLEFAAENVNSLSLSSKKHCQIKYSQFSHSPLPWLEEDTANGYMVTCNDLSNATLVLRQCRFLEPRTKSFTDLDYEVMNEVCSYFFQLDLGTE